MAKFTASHMSQVGAVLKGARPIGCNNSERMWVGTCKRFGDLFAGSNERFNRNKFYETCGLLLEEVSAYRKRDML